MDRQEADRIVAGYVARRYACEQEPKRLLDALARAPIVDEAEISAHLMSNVDVRRRGVRLTERERQIVALMSYGMGNPEISQVLGLTLGTVKTHAKKIQHVLAAKNRTHVVGLALRLGLIE